MKSLRDILQALPEREGYLFPFHALPNEASRMVTGLAKAAALKMTLHDLRRSFGSRYAAVVPAPVLQKLMRHASIQTTMRFYVAIDDQLDSAILKA
jgi:integrase